MAIAGYPDYQPTALPNGPFVDQPLDARTRDQVSADGFVFDSPSSQLSPTEASVADRASADPAYRRALQGEDDDPSVGCAGSSFMVIYGPNSELASAPAELSNLDSEVLFRVEALQDFKTLVSEWVQCMGTRGYTYASRHELANVAWKPPRPSQVELETATADFDCRAHTNYPLRFRNMYNTEHAKLADERGEVVKLLVADIDRYLRALGV
jgi:hypothetical protein